MLPLFGIAVILAGDQVDRLIVFVLFTLDVLVADVLIGFIGAKPELAT